MIKTGISPGNSTEWFELHGSMDNQAILMGFGIVESQYMTPIAPVNRNFPPPAKRVYFVSFNRRMDTLSRFQALAKLSDEIMDGLSSRPSKTAVQLQKHGRERASSKRKDWVIEGRSHPRRFTSRW